MQRWSPCLVLMLLANVALAQPPNAAPASFLKSASKLVRQRLLRPLKRVESRRKRFSRVAAVPVQRRVRWLDGAAQRDRRGDPFVRFAIDVRRPQHDADGWRRAVIVGCAYPKRGRVFVQRGDGFLFARTMLGREAPPAPAQACLPASETPAVAKRG